jgi:uncharacterized DUF497 family protein
VGELRFTWDPKKYRINLARHKVRFEEGQSSFLDEGARVISDPEHSDSEERFVLQRIIHIISARRADPSERRQYAGFIS